MKTLKIIGILVVVLLVVAGGGLLWMASMLDPDIELGSTSPEVSVATLDGEPLPLASLRGNVVLLDFWGST